MHHRHGRLRRLYEWLFGYPGLTRAESRHVRTIRSEYERKEGEPIDAANFSNAERSVFDAILQQITSQIRPGLKRIRPLLRQLERATARTQKAMADYEAARQAERDLEQDQRTGEIEQEYTETIKQTTILKLAGDEPELSPKVAWFSDTVLFVADFAFMLYALNKGFDVPFPGEADFGGDGLALNLVTFLGAFTLSLLGPTVVWFSARHVGTKAADRRARRILAEAEPGDADRRPEPPPARVEPPAGFADRLARAWRAFVGWMKEHGSVVFALSLVLFIACVYAFTAQSRLSEAGRIPSDLAEGIAALLFGLPPATVMTHLSVERSSRHRLARAARERYGKLVGERRRLADDLARALTTWEGAWLALELARVKATMATEMLKEYPRFERMVLLARSLTDRVPLYGAGGTSQPEDTDWQRWLSSIDLLPSLGSVVDGAVLEPTIEALQRLRPPGRQQISAG